MKRWIHAACVAGLLAASLSQAKADSFVMGDHPDGDLISDGAYGLRLDEFDTLWSVGNNILTTSLANVVINFDPGNLSAGATVTGQIQTTYRDNDFIANDLWTLNYTLSGLEAYNGGFAAKSGIGSIVDQDGSDVDNYFDGPLDFIGKANETGYVFLFAPDGFRLDDFGGTYAADTWVARGWVTGYYTETEYYDCNKWGYNCKSREVPKTIKVQDDPNCRDHWENGRRIKCSTHEEIKMKSWDGSNDFLMVSGTGGDIPGDEVPEPSTILLTMGGVALLWFRKRRS